MGWFVLFLSFFLSNYLIVFHLYMYAQKYLPNKSPNKTLFVKKKKTQSTLNDINRIVLF